MTRFMTFVNGGNLFTIFKHLDVFVDDYDALYRYCFTQAVARWRQTWDAPVPPAAQHTRIFWQVVDAMDEWDLSHPRTKQHLAERFLDDREVHNRWVAEAARMLEGTGADPARIEQTAFMQCFDDFQLWYEKKQRIIAGMNRFYHAVESASDAIEIRRSGRWRVDLLRKAVNERGLDVGFAVDLLGKVQCYDVALLIGCEADGTPALPYVKEQGRQVGVIDFVKGAPPEGRPRAYATPLRLAADFVVPIYETDLVRLGLADKGEDDGFGLEE